MCTAWLPLVTIGVFSVASTHWLVQTASALKAPARYYLRLFLPLDAVPEQGCGIVARHVTISRFRRTRTGPWASRCHLTGWAFTRLWRSSTGDRCKGLKNPAAGSIGHLREVQGLRHERSSHLGDLRDWLECAWQCG